MITNFRMFENVNGPEVGDYIIVKIRDKEITSTIKNIENKILKIIDTFRIDQVKVDFGLSGWWIYRSEIIDYDKNKELLELRIKAKKYNL